MSRECDHKWRWSKLLEYQLFSKQILAMWGFYRTDDKIVCQSCGEIVKED